MYKTLICRPGRLLRLYIWNDFFLHVLPFFKAIEFYLPKSKSRGKMSAIESWGNDNHGSALRGLRGRWDNNNIFRLFSSENKSTRSFLPIVSTLPRPPSTVLEARIHVSASIPQLTINKGRLSNKPTLSWNLYYYENAQNRNQSTHGAKP